MSWFCCFSLTVCEFICFLGFSGFFCPVFSFPSYYFPATPVLDLFNRLLPEFFLRLFSLHTFSASPSCFQCFSVHSPHLCFSRLTPPAPELFCISVHSLSSHPLCSHDPAVLVPWCSSMFIYYYVVYNYTSSVVVPTCRLVLLAPPSLLRCNNHDRSTFQTVLTLHVWYPLFQRHQ